MSATQERLAAVPIPKMMRLLPRDARGYPIPAIVLRMPDGTPLFAMNDQPKINKCLRSRLCGVCGRRLTDGAWFVGGVRSFLHADGAFVGPGHHLECAEYSLRVCPFLVARSYTKPIEDKKLDRTALPPNVRAIVMASPFVGDRLPERFGLGLCDRYDIHYRDGEGISIPRRWLYVEFWKHGAPCEPPPSGEAAPW